MKSTALFALFATGMAGSLSAAITTIDATGWNHDMVLNNPTPHNLTVDSTMDNGFGNVENWTWVEEGNYTVWNGTAGVPDSFVDGLVAGTHTSATGSGGSFTFQPFSSNNVLGIDAGATTGSLSLTVPAPYTSFALYGASGGGATSADVTFTFADSSTSTYSIASGTGVGTDWFDFGGSPDVAYQVGGRASNKSEEGYTVLFYQQNDIISLYETLITLNPGDAAKPITDVSLTHTGGGRMTVFAISGEAVPEPSVALLGVFGLLGMLRRRRL